MNEGLFKRNQSEREVEIHLTYKCNLSCPGCDHAGFNKRDSIPPDLTEEVYVNLLDDMERLGWRKRIHLLGGEPTLHKDCIKFARIASLRGFEVMFLSNRYTKFSRDIVEQVQQEGLIHGIVGGSKEAGPRDHRENPYIFCDPIDLGLIRENPCRYTLCGISADQNGCHPCPIGCVLAHYLNRLDVVTPLEKLLNPDHVSRAMEALCKHCGGYLQLETEIREVDRSKIMNIDGTLMTKSWKSIFEV